LVSIVALQQGNSPLHLAVKSNFPQVVQILLRRGAADVNAKTEGTVRCA
jgi:ankyrin repeat protein